MSSPTPGPASTPRDLFAGSGEMSALMRAHDWAASPLGPPEAWPHGLRSVVRILLTSRYAMWLGWGPELTFFYNDAYGTMTLGAKHPWALGRPSSEVWAEIWADIHPRIDKVLTSGEATWDERLLLFLERSGYQEETYHTFSYSPLADDDGAIRGMFCVVTEETERVIDERRLEVLKALGTHLAAAKNEPEVFRASAHALTADSRDLAFTALYVLDGNGQATLASRTNIPDAAAVPTHAPVAELAARWGLPDLERLATLAVVAAPVFAGWPAGPWDRRAQEMFIAPIRQQGPPGPAGIFIAGVNPFRRVDEKYRSFVDLFVGQLAAGLAGARAYEQERQRAEALAAIDRAKTVFFSNVSHEFRTPLTLMLGPTEDALNAPDQALRGEDLKTVYRNEVRLLRLVNALLDFSRIEAGRVQPHFEPVDVSEVTRDLAGVFRSAVERAGLRLRVDCPPLGTPVHIDRQMWEKVVLNLLSNAFKFTFDGEIGVTMRLEEGCVRLAVSDTGVGITAAELPRVFERFHRIEGTRARTHEGSGIGLALVHDLVELHGGSIAVESEPGRGTTFTITLRTGTAHLPAGRVGEPAAPGSAVDRGAFVAEAERWLPSGISDPQLPPLGDAAAQPPAAGQERILIADDNADMREYLARLLSTRWAVETVGDGIAALEAIRDRRPTLLLSDVMMPRLDGVGLLREIRRDPATRTLPVIMLSARAGEESRIEGLEAGADDYLVKPFSARELMARVATRLDLQRLGTRLEALAADAAAANHAKDEFLAMLGHELRNPLAPILTALQLMQLKGITQVDRERTIIERQTRHLVRLVDDLLDVSRIARGKIQLKRERVEVATIVARAVELTSPLLEERGIALEIDVAPSGLVLDVDPARLAQAVANLLTNAAKYSEPGGHVSVRAALSGAEITIAVRDQGIGIPPEMLPRIFDVFVQERQTLDRSHGGLGLGLTIVRNIVSLHGGTAAAASDGIGLGSEFVLRLPAAPGVVASPPRAPAEAAAEAGGVPILIVDDNEDAAAMLAESLSLKGHQVRVAADGPAALRAIADFAPAVALLDIGLPGMDGYELAAHLRGNPKLRDVGLVAVTGYGQRADRDRAAAAGFDAHLVKPVDIDHLEKVLREVLDAAR